MAAVRELTHGSLLDFAEEQEELDLVEEMFSDKSKLRGLSFHREEDSYNNTDLNECFDIDSGEVEPLFQPTKNMNSRARVGLDKKIATFDYQFERRHIWIITSTKSWNLAATRAFDLFLYFLSSSRSLAFIRSSFFAGSFAVAAFDVGVIASTMCLSLLATRSTRDVQFFAELTLAFSLLAIGSSQNVALLSTAAFGGTHMSESGVQLSVLIGARLLAGMCVSCVLHEWAFAAALFVPRSKQKSAVNTLESAWSIGSSLFALTGYCLQHLGVVNVWYVFAAVCVMHAFALRREMPEMALLASHSSAPVRDLFPPFCEVLSSVPLLLFFVGFAVSAFANSCLCIAMAPWLQTHYGLTVAGFGYALLVLAVSQLAALLLSRYFKLELDSQWRVVAGVALQLCTSLALLGSYFLLNESQGLRLVVVLAIVCFNFIGFEFAYANAVAAALHLVPSIRSAPVGNLSRVVVSMARILGAIVGVYLWISGDFGRLIVALCGCYAFSLTVVTCLGFFTPKTDFEQVLE